MKSASVGVLSIIELKNARCNSEISGNLKGLQTKKEHLYCRVLAERSGLGVVRKLEIMSGKEMERM